MPRAFTRAVSPRIAECALTHLERQPIDPVRAAEQHSAYELALADAGFDIVRLPDLPHDPDAVFVEDTAILLGDDAVITRPGATSRAGEAEHAARELAPHFTVHRLDAARLYRLAFEKTASDKNAGVARYHAVGEEGVPAKEIAEAIGRGLKMPVVAVAPERGVEHFGFLGNFAGLDMPASSALTQKRLGWEPIGPGLIRDLEAMKFDA